MSAVLAPLNAVPMTVTIVRDKQELQEVTPAWLEFLERGTVGHNVHNDPRMVSLALKQHPSLSPHILLIWRDDSLVGVAPFYVQPACFSFEISIWKLLSIPAQTMRIFGESVILAADVEPEPCLAAICEFLKGSSLPVDFLQIYGLNRSERFWQAALRGNTFSQRSGWVSLAMRQEKIHNVLLKSSFDEFVASLSSGTRQTLRYSRRRFFRDGRARIEKCTGRCDVLRMLDWVDSVYSNSWQAKAFGNVGRGDAAHQTFFERAADEGWLRSYFLLRDDEPVAYQLGLQYRRVYYLLDCAYRQNSAAASPGSVLTFCVLEDLHTDRAVDVWDFGFGDMPYKRSFSNLEHDASTVYFIPPNRWRHILRLQTALNSAYDFVRSGIIRIGAGRFVRKLIKRQK